MVLCEKECFVLSSDKNDVEIEIAGLRVLFPKNMFPENSLSFGSHFMYQIKIKDYIRYEHFEPISVETPPEIKREILERLSTI